jgi:hypothetical protein
LRKQFNVEDEEDFWETLFNNAFDDEPGDLEPVGELGSQEERDKG